MRRSFSLLPVLAMIGLALATVSPPSEAQPIGEPESDQMVDQVTDQGGSVNVVIPGFYSVGAFEPGGGPAGIEIDPATGYLWVVDSSGHRVDVLAHDGSVVLTIGSFGSGDGEFDVPVAVGVVDGEAFVTDLHNDRVQVFDTATGAFLRAFGSGVLTEPCGIAVTDTQVFVANAGDDEVVIFTTAGSFVTSFDGGANGPIAVGCFGDAIDIDINSSELHVDGSSNRVVTFDLTGTWLREFTINGSGLGTIQVDAIGQIWVGTYIADTIQIYTSAGVFVAQMDESGAALGQLDLPRDIAIDPTGNTFWVTEDSNNRIQAFTKLLCAGDILTQVGTSFDDDFDGTSGDDTVLLGPGDDTYRGLGGDDKVCGGGGSDDIRGGGGADEISGGAGDDVIVGQGGTDSLLGGGGADEIDGQGAADTLDGGAGADTLTGQNGGDTFIGGPGQDIMRGNTGPDTMMGEGGDDELFGGEGADVLYGGAGIDKCSGNTGPDSAEAATCETTPGVETLF